MSQQVQFVYLTQDEYDSLSPKVESRLYFTSDTNKIYRGSTLYSSRLVEDLTNWGETNINFNELQAKTLQVEDPETKEMKNVSLEGHVHDEYLTSDDIKDFITSDDLKDEVEFGSIEADELKVNGKDVSLEGHTHTKSEIDDFPTNVSSFTNDAGYLTEADLQEVKFNELAATSLKVDGKDVSLEDHTHTKSEITDFPTNVSEFENDSQYITIDDVDLSECSKVGHKHTKSDITDFSHQHYKTEILDFDHIHTKEDIIDFEHTHQINEVNGLIEALDELKFNETEIFITEED